jgi:hypothetical protein
MLSENHHRLAMRFLAALILIILVYAWASRGGSADDNDRLPNRQAENAEDLEARKPEQDQWAQGLAEETSKKPRTLEVSIRLIDVLTQNPVSGCEIVSAGKISVADSNGIAVLNVPLDGIFTGELRFPDRFGPRDILTLRTKFDPLGEKKPKDLLINAHSGLRIVTAGIELGTLSFSVVPQPKDIDVAEDFGLSDVYRGLLLDMATDPYEYLKVLRTLTATSTWPEVEQCEATSIESDSFHQISGRVAINFLPRSSGGVLYSPSWKTAKLIPGEVVSIDIEVHEKPVIKGFVKDREGNPIAGASVTIATKTQFSGDKPVPRFDDEPNNPAFIVRGTKGTGRAIGIAQLTRRTNASGEFEIAVPFVKNLAVWVQKSGYLMGYQALGSYEYYESVSGIKVVLFRRPTIPKSTILLLSSEGKPLVNMKVHIIQHRPPHSFQLSYSGLCSDKDGVIDASDIPVGKLYVGFFDDPDLPGSVQFIHHTSTVLNLSTK